MRHMLSSELVSWYRLVDPPADHAEEAEIFHDAFQRAIEPAPETLLELGAGAGHNALHLKRWFRCTLADLSPEMSGLSQQLNPECEHLIGDMRSMRLGRTFDAVLVHDAISYMRTRDDLHDALQTVFVHTRPGGAAIIAPDHYRETFEEQTLTEHASEGERTLHNLMWHWDPDPSDDECTTEFAMLMRDGKEVRAFHEAHVGGLFSRTTWEELLADVGFQVEPLPRPIGDDQYDSIFLCRRGARDK